MNLERDHSANLILPTLTGARIELRPMTGDDAPNLLRAAADGRLWELKVTVVPGPDTVEEYIATALRGKQAGTVMPFVIVNRETSAVVGSTRFWKIDHVNRRVGDRSYMAWLVDAAHGGEYGSQISAATRQRI